MIDEIYNEAYYHSGCGPIPYEEPEHWVRFFGYIADRIVEDLHPKTVLDAGCAMGYLVETELTVLMLDDVALALLPGEIFPELVLGGSYGSASPQQENPTPLREIAAAYGVEQLVVVGLADDEVGYIVPPSDFLVNPQWPYFEKIRH